MVFILLFLFLVSGFALAGLVGAPWVPTYRRDVEKIIADCQLKHSQLFIELGCGDGRLVAAAAKRGAKAIGYEINPVMWLVANLRNFKNPTAKIKLANFWQAPVGKADVVFVFLIPKYMARMETKLQTELKPGAKAVSYVYKLPKKEPALKRQKWILYKF